MVLTEPFDHATADTAARFQWYLDHRGATPTVLTTRDYDEDGPSGPGREPFGSLLAAVAEIPGWSSTGEPFEIELIEPDDPQVFAGDAVRRSHELLNLVFGDGSILSNPPTERPDPSAEGPLDVGALLLKPVTRRELAGIEPLLGVLWEAIDQDTLSETHQAQIIAMAALIANQHRDAIPDETERWKLVGPVRAALKYLVKEVPRDGLAWWKFAELLTNIDWTQLAGELPGP